MTHDVEKFDVQRELHDRIIAAIRASVTCFRISGFVRVDSNSSSLHVPLCYPELPADDSSPRLGPLHYSSSPPSPAAPKVSRRKAYLPRRIAGETTPERCETPEPFGTSAGVLAPSMTVFPTATPQVVLTEPTPTFPAAEPLRHLLPKPSGRHKPRTFRTKSSTGAKRSPNKEFSCNQCLDKFRSLNSLTEHTTAVHQCFRCTTCNAKFTQRSNLQRHSLKHLGFKPFKCAICKKEYYRKDHLVRHVEVSHPGSDPKASIVNVLPSAECLRLAEEERRRRSENPGPIEEAAVDLSIGRNLEDVASASSEPLIEQEDGRRAREEEAMEEEGEVNIGGERTAAFLLNMSSLTG